MCVRVKGFLLSLFMWVLIVLSFVWGVPFVFVVFSFALFMAKK